MLKERLGSVSGGRILDVATGGGSFISYIVEGFRDYEEIIGIDSSDRAIEAANKTFVQDSIHFIQMDAENMEFEDESFDCVCISNSLHHFANTERVLIEMKRVLKPGGIFLINEMICDNQRETQMTHVFIHHWWGKIDTQRGIVHNETLKKADIVCTANTLGLRDIDMWEFADDDEHAMDSENIEYMIGTIDRYLNIAKDFRDFKELKAAGDKLKERLKSLGITGATQLMVMGTK